MGYEFKTPNGSSIDTPGGLPDIEQWRENGAKFQRLEYSNGLIIITEQVGRKVYVDSNFSFTNTSASNFKPLYDHANPDFVDRHEK